MTPQTLTSISEARLEQSTSLLSADVTSRSVDDSFDTPHTCSDVTEASESGPAPHLSDPAAKAAEDSGNTSSSTEAGSDVESSGTDVAAGSTPHRAGPSVGRGSEADEDEPSNEAEAGCSQCERNPLCVRGYRHGGHGGRCSMPKRTLEADQVCSKLKKRMRIREPSSQPEAGQGC